MAWLTNENPQEFTSTPLEPDSMTLLYWVSRLEPLIRADSNQEVIVVFANRCGIEGDATYAGTSTVVGIQSGEIWVYGIMGRGETGLLVVDTDSEPYAKLAYSPLQPKVQSGNDVPPESEASSNNDPYPEQKNRDQVLDSPDDHYKQSSDYSRENTRGDEQTWHVESTPNLGGQDYHESPKYFGKPLDNGAPEPKVSHAARESKPRLDIKSLQLDIPPDQYMLRRYLEAESPVSHREMSTFSNQSTTAPLEELRGLQKGTDEFVPFYPDMAENDKRFSLRSDVSVWNNQPGRVRQLSVSMIDAPDLPHITAQERSRTAEAGGGTRPEESYRNKYRAHSQRQSSDWNSRRGSDYDGPLSRQSSQNQLRRKYSQNQIDDVARSYSSSAVLPAYLMQSHSASQVAPEETGRGRRRSSHKHLRDARRGSRGTQISQREVVDLSQFTLIEEYPSASCPVHGSRPPSGTRQQNHSRARGRSGSHSQHVKEGGTTRRASTRRDASQNERPRDNHRRPSGRTHSSKPEQTRPSDEKKREDEATTTTNSGPRTPTAMLLVPDLELPDGLEKTFSLLKCVEKAPEHIVRRRVSSIW